MNNPYDDIIALHKRFGISGTIEEFPPRLLTQEEFNFRLLCLKEETKEYKDATTIEEQIDALIDLITFGLGTLERMGVDFQPHWDEVLLTNFRKELHTNARDSKRNYADDLKKPLGWQAPNHVKILKRYK